MATQELTPRQQEIKALLEQGKAPKDIAKKLKITDNAVYQQVRRIRAGGASGRSTSGAARSSSGSSSSGSSSRSRSRTSGRKSSGSTRTRNRPTRRAAAPVSGGGATAEQMLKSEITAGEALIAERETEISAAQSTIEGLKAQNVATAEELERKRQTLAVLTGEMVAHAKPKARPARSRGKSTRSSGSKNGSQATSSSQDASGGASSASTGGGSQATEGGAKEGAPAAS